jgi:hypothetical protein
MQELARTFRFLEENLLAIPNQYFAEKGSIHENLQRPG